MITGAHQHLCDLERVYCPWPVPGYGPIHRTFEPAELELQLVAEEIDQTVLVQMACDFEDTEAMLAHAAEHAWIGAVVGWAPLCAHRLGAGAGPLHASSTVRGCPPPQPPRARSRLAGAAGGHRGLAHPRGARFDVRCRRGLSRTPAARAHAGCGMPAPADRSRPPRQAADHIGPHHGWASEMRTAAEHPSVFAKISGLNTAAAPGRWSPSDLVEPVEMCVEAFGPERLMFGSDWPVAILAGDHAKVWSATNTALDEIRIHGADREAILGGTAAGFYGIEAV